jgi:hypothetical protein
MLQSATCRCKDMSVGLWTTPKTLRWNCTYHMIMTNLFKLNGPDCFLIMSDPIDPILDITHLLPTQLKFYFRLSDNVAFLGSSFFIL